MEHKKSQFHMEAAGSLTPELEGAPASGPHCFSARTKGEQKGPAADGKAPMPQVRPRNKAR